MLRKLCKKFAKAVCLYVLHMLLYPRMYVMETGLFQAVGLDPQSVINNFNFFHRFRKKIFRKSQSQQD